MDAAKICVQQILTVSLQNYTKISFKMLYKNLSYLYFSRFFLQHVSNRLYPNVKIILAQFITTFIYYHFEFWMLF